MCGVFGLVGRPDMDVLTLPLFQVNCARGRDALGYGEFTKEHSRRVRLPLRMGTYNLDEYAPIVRNGTSIIANLRAEPTTEHVNNIQEKDCQPYTVGNWTIVHNGTIANDKDLISKHGLSPPTEIDSWVIAALCNMFGFDGMLKRIVGSYAILAVDQRDPTTIRYAVNYKPLYQIWTPPYNGRALSSEPLTGRDQPIQPYTYGELAAPYGVLTRGRCPGYLRENVRANRALSVISGGLDSAVATHMLVAKGWEVELLHFNYGCRATAAEAQAVENLSWFWNVPLYTQPMDLFTTSASGSRLTGGNERVAESEAGAEYAHEWVPARNLVMLATATAIAEARGFDAIAIGANLEEAGAYPDNEPEFIRRFRALLPYATGDGKMVRLEAPVAQLMKHEIVAEGLASGAPMHLTWSCYENGDRHCGKCGPCFMRRTAFEINGAKDPVFEEAPA